MTDIDTAAIRARSQQHGYQEGQALQDVLALCNEVDRLRTIIDNLHHVEKKHRGTANDHFHRANRLRAENERLRAALGDVIDCDHHNHYDGPPPKYVRVALAARAQKEEG